MKTDKATLDAFQEFCRAMAERWQGVWGYECWNEPNLHLTLYPQSTSTDKDFGAHVYLKMLRRFSAGVHEGDPAAQRLAGGTAPRGYKATDRLSSRRMMTSPQRFARGDQGGQAERLRALRWVLPPPVHPRLGGQEMAGGAAAGPHDHREPAGTCPPCSRCSRPSRSTSPSTATRRRSATRSAGLRQPRHAGGLPEARVRLRRPVPAGEAPHVVPARRLLPDRGVRPT